MKHQICNLLLSVFLRQYSWHEIVVHFFSMLQMTSCCFLLFALLPSCGLCVVRTTFLCCRYLSCSKHACQPKNHLQGFLWLQHNVQQRAEQFSSVQQASVATIDADYKLQQDVNCTESAEQSDQSEQHGTAASEGASELQTKIAEQQLVWLQTEQTVQHGECPQ